MIVCKIPNVFVLCQMSSLKLYMLKIRISSKQKYYFFSLCLFVSSYSTRTLNMHFLVSHQSRSPQRRTKSLNGDPSFRNSVCHAKALQRLFKTPRSAMRSLYFQNMIVRLDYISIARFIYTHARFLFSFFYLFRL